ncbi:hypothetical protein JHK86_033011 [Glycine max]|nr:hypothetical protein JHK86_033011 [Glycine max]
MNQMTKHLACEWAKDNIRTNCVAPGPIRTPLGDKVIFCWCNYSIVVCFLCTCIL